MNCQDILGLDVEAIVVAADTGSPHKRGVSGRVKDHHGHHKEMDGDDNRRNSKSEVENFSERCVCDPICCLILIIRFDPDIVLIVQ